MKKILLKLKNENNNAYTKFKSHFLFHSNKIEGSTFSLEQLNLYLEKRQLSGTHDLNDVFETINSVDLFDYIIEDNRELSLFVLSEYHAILKKNTTDEKLGFAGVFKKIPNSLSGVDLKLSQPYEVEYKLRKLLEKYSEITELKELVEFHYKFELIHPFSDGNGRIGRFIILKQCIENNIKPIIIDNENELEYKNSLFLAQTTDNISSLIEVFIQGQKKYDSLCADLISIEQYVQNDENINTDFLKNMYSQLSFELEYEIFEMFLKKLIFDLNFDENSISIILEKINSDFYENNNFTILELSREIEIDDEIMSIFNNFDSKVNI